MAKKEKNRDLVPRRYVSPSEIMMEFDRVFDDFRDEFEDIFQRPFEFGGYPIRKERGLHIPREPLTDLVDRGDRFELVTEMPGIDKKKIETNVSKDSIEIKAEIEEKGEEKEGDYVYKERSYKGFYRKINIPTEIIPDKAEAVMKDGMLRITLPKKKPKEKTETRKIKVR